MPDQASPSIPLAIFIGISHVCFVKEEAQSREGHVNHKEKKKEEMNSVWKSHGMRYFAKF